MDLVSEFSNKVLLAIKARQEKAKAICDGMENFIDWGIASHKDKPMNGYYQALSHMTYRHSSDEHYPEWHSFDVTSLYDGENYGFLSVNINASGLIKILLRNREWDHNGNDSKRMEFGMDDLSAEDTIAKVFTVIQDMDYSAFGDFLTVTGLRMWEAQGNNLETAPGYRLEIDFGPQTP